MQNSARLSAIAALLLALAVSSASARHLRRLRQDQIFNDVLAVRFQGETQDKNTTELLRLDGTNFNSIGRLYRTGLHVTARSSWQYLSNADGDLYGIKYNGESQTTEVHVLSAASSYKQYTLQTKTALLPSSLGTYRFALASNNDLFAIKLNGDSNTTEVHILTAASKYQQYALQTKTALPPTSYLTWDFDVDADNNLYGIKYNGSSKTTEVHVLSASSKYQQYTLETKTALDVSSYGTWKFLVADNGDLYGIKYVGASNTTEVHVVTADSGYQSYSLQTKTALETTGPDTFQFAINKNNDLYAYKYNGASGTTEVHIQLAADGYSKFAFQKPTLLPVTVDPSAVFTFATNSNLDLFGIKYTGASGHVEVHQLTASSDYARFALHQATALPASSPGEYKFLVNDKGDLIAIKYNGASNTTEVHILSAASKYQQYTLQTKTALHVTTPATWDFSYNFNTGDIYGITYNGASKKVEVHVLTSSSLYKELSLEQATAIDGTDAATSAFDVANSGDLYAVKYNKADKTAQTTLSVLSPSDDYKSFQLENGNIRVDLSSQDLYQFLVQP